MPVTPMQHLRTGLLAVTFLALPAFARAQTAEFLRPDKLVVLSTTDMQGKLMPCGCKVPKGGLARLSAFTDSIRAEYGQVLRVDNGGWFPMEPDKQEVAAFLMDALTLLGTDAVGIGDRELRYGRAFLLANARRTNVPLTCANLTDRSTRKPLVAPYLVRKAGGVTVGVFALASDKADLGTQADSVAVEDPVAAARRTVDELHRKGATVIVLLSHLDKSASEDLVVAVPGIDVLVCGRNSPLLQAGRLIGDTVVCYGGDQAQAIGRTIVTLGPGNRMAKGANETFPLTAEVGENAQVLALVTRFEDAQKAKAVQREKEAAAAK